MRSSYLKINPFNYHFFRIYIYHPALFFFNLFRFPQKCINLFLRIKSDNVFRVYGFNILSPKKINNYFFANLNAKFSSFILEKYEYREKELISKYLSKSDVVLELGGCIGVISLTINRILNFNKNHVVLEVDKNNMEFLEINKKRNKGKFKIIYGVLSNDRNLFYKKSHSFWGGKVVKDKTSEPIRSYNLGQLEKITNLKFNTLVMDIEGGETDVIKDLDLQFFKKLLFEIHFEREDLKYLSIEKKLKKNNFKKKETNGKVEYWEK